MPVEDVPPGEVRQVTDGRRTYAVANVDGTIYAVDGDCPHRNGPLGHGAMNGHSVVCPWHCWQFDVRTGESDIDSGCVIATFPVKVEDGMIHIEVS